MFNSYKVKLPFDCFVNVWATCEIFLGKSLTAPLWQKIARTPMKGCTIGCQADLVSFETKSPVVRQVLTFNSCCF